MIINKKFTLTGITSYTTYESGAIKECKLEKYNRLKVGKQYLVPRFTPPDERKKDGKAIAFYESGMVKSIATEEPTPVSTAIGMVSAELITFYEDGSVESLFPLNGQLGFGWSLEDEEKFLEDLHFDLPCGSFTTKIIGLRFYPHGELKSMILWPGNNIEIDSPLGRYPVRIGFRLYQDGSLESFEPGVPVLLNTPIGSIMAFDHKALGMDADFNSVRFYPDGRLRALSTNSDIVAFSGTPATRDMIYQQLKLDMMTGELTKQPVNITFSDGTVVFDNGNEKRSYFISESKFMFLHDGSYLNKKCNPGSDCSGCGASCM